MFFKKDKSKHILDTKEHFDIYGFSSNAFAMFKTEESREQIKRIITKNGTYDPLEGVKISLDYID